MVHVTYAWYIRELAIACQIHSYLSINTTYTHLQPHNKLSILQKSKIQEILLENPYFMHMTLGLGILSVRKILILTLNLPLCCRRDISPMHKLPGLVLTLWTYHAHYESRIL